MHSSYRTGPWFNSLLGSMALLGASHCQSSPRPARPVLDEPEHIESAEPVAELTVLNSSTSHAGALLLGAVSVPPPTAANSSNSTFLLGSSDLTSKRDEGFGPREGDWELILIGSGSNDSEFDGGAGSVNLSAGYFISDMVEIALRQGVLYSDFGDSRTDGSTRVAMDFHLPLDRVYPFAGGNLGYVYGESIKETFEAAPEIGVKWFLKPEAFLYLMGEYQFFFRNANRIDNRFENGQFVYSLGAGFTF